MGQVVNTVKAGSTVPLKFEVFTGDTERTTTSSITGIAAITTTCETGVPGDEIEVTSTSAAGLSYDAAAGVFTYNWKTPKAGKGCYELKLSTTDGSSLTAAFQLR